MCLCVSIRWQAKFRSVSLRLGYVGNICWAFLFFPITRGSSILPLLGLTSESSIKYHIWLGHISMVLFAAHTIGFIIYWAITHQMVLVYIYSSLLFSDTKPSHRLDIMHILNIENNNEHELIEMV